VPHEDGGVMAALQHLAPVDAKSEPEAVSG